MATRKQPELSSHAEVTAAYVARVASINDVHANEIEDLERAKTRAHVAKAAALKTADREFQAERLARHTHVVSDVLEVLRNVMRPAEASWDLGRVEPLGKAFTLADARKLRLLGCGLTNELGILLCDKFAERVPGAVARFATDLNWNRITDDGIQPAVARANAAFRNPHDLIGAQRALIELSATVARVGSAPGYPTAHPDEAAELWAIKSAILPPDLEEERRKALADVMKAKASAAAIAEQELRVSAVRGSAAAREALNSRGPGVLEAVLTHGKSILFMALGHNEEKPAL